MSASRANLNRLVELSRLAERVSAKEVKNFEYFAKKSQGYRSKLAALPAEMPKINWDLYKSKLHFNQDFVDEMKQELDSLKIPYPEDTKYLEEIEEQTEEAKKTVNFFIKKSKERIEIYERRRDFYMEMMPFAEMTLEDYYNFCPAEAIDFIQHPTFWPHNRDEQLADFLPSYDGKQSIFVDEEGNIDGGVEDDAIRTGKAALLPDAIEDRLCKRKPSLGGAASGTLAKMETLTAEQMETDSEDDDTNDQHQELIPQI